MVAERPGALRHSMGGSKFWILHLGANEFFNLQHQILKVLPTPAKQGLSHIEWSWRTRPGERMHIVIWNEMTMQVK